MNPSISYEVSIELYSRAGLLPCLKQTGKRLEESAERWQIKAWIVAFTEPQERWRIVATLSIQYDPIRCIILRSNRNP